jgi:hypothetical protein
LPFANRCAYFPSIQHLGVAIHARLELLDFSYSENYVGYSATRREDRNHGFTLTGATAALFGAVGSVVLGGVGTVLIATGWLMLFPALAKKRSNGAGMIHAIFVLDCDNIAKEILVAC